uniref:Uncharacterized protein n=1 Tax=Helicotheca tamesis TaxID=374047 RepID=A0A7S2HXY6_9STRA
MIGSSRPLTRTTKLPLPGFSALITTLAFLPTAFWILLARVLNAPHCLHASMVTVLLLLLSAVASLSDESLATAADLAFFSGFFFAAVVFLAGGAAAAPAFFGR